MLSVLEQLLYSTPGAYYLKFTRSKALMSFMISSSVSRSLLSISGIDMEFHWMIALHGLEGILAVYINSCLQLSERTVGGCYAYTPL